MIAAGALGGCKPNTGIIRAATVPGIYSAPAHLALERGYFSQAGLSVSLDQIESDAQATVLLAGGQVDVALAALTPVFVNAVLRGRRLRVVAARQIAARACGAVGTLYGNRAAFPRGLEDLRQLKGRRIAVTSATSFTAFCLDAFLATVGLKTADVIVVPLRPRESIAALVAGKLDAAVVSQLEYDLTARSPNLIQGIGIASIYPDFQVSFAMFSSRLLDREPRAGIGFLAAYLRGASGFAAGDTPRFLYDYARESRLDPEKLRAGCHDWFAAGGLIDRSSIERWADWMYARGFVNGRPVLAELIDSRFLDEIRSRT